MVVEVILSDGLPFRVKRAGLFDLDQYRPDPLGDFTYETDMFGRKYDMVFDLTMYGDTPPVKPAKEPHKILPDSREWHQLMDYQLYQAALLHEERRKEQVTKFVEDCARHIIINCCLDDLTRIVDRDDWAKVYEAALAEQLTMSLIGETLKKTYQAKFNKKPIFEVLATIEDEGYGEYNQIRLWENKLMVALKMNEAEYTLLPLAERARKICTIFLEDIMSYLESKMRQRNDKLNKISKETNGPDVTHT